MSCRGKSKAYCDGLAGSTKLSGEQADAARRCVKCHRPLMKDGLCIAGHPQLAPVAAVAIGEYAARAASEFSTAVQSGRIERSVGIGYGATEARIVKYTDDGRGVWKEIRAAWNPHLGRYMHDGHSEVAAFRLAQLLGKPEVVPETVFDQGNVATSQRFMEDVVVAATIPPRPGVAPYYAMGTPPPPEWDLYSLLQAQSDHVYTLLAMDVIMGQCDRHGGNFVFDEQGNLRGIDHGHATWQPFGGQDILHWPLSNSTLLMYFYGKDAKKEEPVTVLRHETVFFPLDMVERWRGISRDQFMAAFDGVQQAGNVNLEVGWQNLQYILEHDGQITW